MLEQKAFLRSFIQRIDISKSDVTINYTLPTPPRDEYAETIGVLGFKQNGGRYCSKDRTFTITFPLKY
jgi:hypothetical protein